jgi:hypothetical protein
MRDDLVACHSCGEINAEASERIEVLEGDLTRTERAMRGLRRVIATLEGERGRKLESDPKYPQAKEVLTSWKTLCMPTAREPYSETRIKPALARLHGGYTVPDLRSACQGYARFPYIVRHRRTAFGQPTDRMVEAEFIFRNPANVDRGIAMVNADINSDQVPGHVAKVPWSVVWAQNQRLVIAAMRKYHQHGGRQPTPQTCEWPCPWCQRSQRSGVMVVQLATHPRGQIAHCDTCQKTENDVLKAILDTDALLG